MKLDIPYYIRQVLREKRMVTIPGIGTFKLEQHIANFNDDKTVISPPSLHLTFNETESSDQSLLQYILDTGLLTEKKAKEKIDQFTQSAFNTLLNVDSFTIEGVGTIKRREGDEKVYLESKLQDLTREYIDLKPLALTPIARISEQSNVAANLTPYTTESDSRSFLPRIIILSILLIALYFFGKQYFSSSGDDPQKAEAGIESKDDKDVLSDSSKMALEQKYEEIDELIDPLTGKKSLDDSSDNSKLNEELDNLSTKEDLISTGEGMGGSDFNKESISSTEGNQQNKYAHIIPETGECIIIVGSFKKPRNAVKMVSLLERKGYGVYQSEYQGYTRVGIKYECIDEDLESYLQEIRKEISTKAWYLDPELDVPYLK